MTDKSENRLDSFLVSAHELRTSLSAMKWLFKMLLDGDLGPLNKSQSEMLLQATVSNERMITLITTTLKGIRDEEHSASYEMVRLDFAQLVEDTIQEFTPEAAQKGMHIRHLSSRDQTCHINAHPEKIRTVLHNVIENAIKYGNADTDIDISLEVRDTTAHLAICDRGLIIPQNEQSFIFQKFFRSSNVETIGLGIGLYATREIVLQHGGTISFSSSKNAGTTFTITLPCVI